ncbi:hypothetical protein [Streptomyces violascens]|uniref:hypothetical protein n=1 Tax=Streptomyces violascens TaxID=67381 RepID=UPI003669E7FD
MAMLAAGRFTIGSVLEEQADTNPEDSTTQPAEVEPAVVVSPIRELSRAWCVG